MMIDDDYSGVTIGLDTPQGNSKKAHFHGAGIVGSTI
jgi:hypothetical protein